MGCETDAHTDGLFSRQTSPALSMDCVRQEEVSQHQCTKYLETGVGDGGVGDGIIKVCAAWCGASFGRSARGNGSVSVVGPGRRHGEASAAPSLLEARATQTA